MFFIMLTEVLKIKYKKFADRVSCTKKSDDKQQMLCAYSL